MQSSRRFPLAAALILGLAPGCKSKTGELSLKGLTADLTTKTVNYPSFFDVKTNELRITHVIAYESSYHTPRGSSAGADEGTAAAYRLISWVKGEGATNLFRGAPQIDTNDFPADQSQVKIGSMYVFAAHFKGVPLDWPGKDAGIPAAVGVRVRIVLGSSIVPAADGSLDGGAPVKGDACASEPDSGMFGGPNYVMPASFCNELARGLVEDDLVSYNGHIWTSEEELPTVPGEPAEVNATTLKLAQRMQDLRAANGSRAKQTLVFMNACHAERIEKRLMEGLIGGPGSQPPRTYAAATPAAPTPSSVYVPGSAESGGTPPPGAGLASAPTEPLLLSHRNFSNFGFFAEHDAILMIDVLNGRPLVNIMLDLTTTLRPESLQDLAGAPVGNESVDAAKKILAKYVNDPEVKADPKRVIIVAYDIEDGRVSSGQDAP